MEQKINEIIIKIKQNSSWIIPVLAFVAGCVCTGLFFFRSGSGESGRLAKRYDNQHGRAIEIIGKLESELARERELNNALREHNNRAREIADSLTDSAYGNVRNLQDAVSLIGEIRKKIKVLADFYDNSDPGNSGN